jgi:hypothetical protein
VRSSPYSAKHSGVAHEGLVPFMRPFSADNISRMCNLRAEKLRLHIMGFFV